MHDKEVVMSHKIVDFCVNHSTMQSLKDAWQGMKVYPCFVVNVGGLAANHIRILLPECT